MTERDEPINDTSALEHGRIGYGRYARYSPLGLAVLLVLVLLAIGIAQRKPAESTHDLGDLVGQQAPEFTLTLLDGSTLRLSNLRGSVVALNFWADWCAPCKNELPRLQAIASDATRSGQPVTVVGVGSKRDYDKNARDLIDRLGLTFPVGRDTAGDDELNGPIQLMFGVTNYPTTIFIRPDGIVAAVHIGELSEDQLRAYLAAAEAETA